ncbi:MAG: universal stress protein [Candidatus Methylomirabilales bacterium]
MYRRILVPLDGSELAEQVLPYVRILGKSLPARIELLRVFEPVSPSLADPAHGLYLHRIITSVRTQMQDYLDSVAASLRKDGLTVSTIVHEGNPAPSIVQESETVPDTMVAMCTHGRSGITRWVLGSTTDKVLHATSHPILIVRVRHQQGDRAKVKLRSLLVPLDGSTIAEQALPHAVALATALGLNIILLKVTQSAEEYPLPASDFAGYPLARIEGLIEQRDAEAQEYLETVCERLREQGLASVEGRVVHGHPGGTIIDLSREIPHCMVAMTTHGVSGIDRWIRGSVADRVVRHSTDPVLVIRATKEISGEALL